MDSRKKYQILGMTSSLLGEGEYDELSPLKRCHQDHNDNNNINHWEDKGSPAIRGDDDGSRRGLQLGFKIKIKGSSIDICDHQASAAAAHNKKSNNTSNCCYLCRKSFPTIKSLCGHMRSHPEREWRGIQPPLQLHDVASSSSNHSSSASVAPVAVDLSGSLCWGWSTTAKRGRESLSSSSCHNNLRRVGVGEVEQHHMEEGVYELMLLAGVLQCEEEDTSKMKKNELAASVESSAKSLKSLTYDQEKEEGSDHGSSVGIDIGNRNMNWRNKKKKKKKKKKKGTKKMKLNEIGTTILQGGNKLDAIGTAKRYKCSICNKSFLSYQALGGHLSIHKKKSNNIQSLVEFESHEQDHHHGNTTTIMQAFDETKISVEDDALGSCSNNKTFSTGEAIWDHNMIPHWNWIGGRAEIQSSEELEKGQSCPKILSFDLNMLPAMDEEEEGIQSDLIIPLTNILPSSYHASSSQNSVTN